MKTLKICIIAIAIAAVVFAVWRIFDGPTPPQPPKPEPPRNTFVEGIEQDIDSLLHLPDSVHPTKMYQAIRYSIETEAKECLLGDNEADNGQWHDILQKNLFSVYVTKYFELAKHTFDGSQWDETTLQYLKAEGEVIAASPLLEDGSQASAMVDTTKKTINQFYSALIFIKKCQSFSYNDYSLHAEFPVKDVKEMVSKSRVLKSSRVGNCERVREQLEAIPSTMLKKHADYLAYKAEMHLKEYRNYDNYNIFKSTALEPINRQLSDMSNIVYGVSPKVFDSNQSRVKETIDKYKNEAFNHF